MSLRPFGIRSRPLVRTLPSPLPVVESAAEELDVVREASDGSIWHLGFETGSASPARLARHHLAVVEAYPGRAVRGVVFWCGGQRVRPSLRCGQIAFPPHQVRSAGMDGEVLLDRQLAAARREPLGAEDILILGLLRAPRLRVRRRPPAVPQATRRASNGTATGRQACPRRAAVRHTGQPLPARAGLPGEGPPRRRARFRRVVGCCVAGAEGGTAWRPGSGCRLPPCYAGEREGVSRPGAGKPRQNSRTSPTTRFWRSSSAG